MTKTAAANAESGKGGVGLQWGVETQGGEREEETAAGDCLVEEEDVDERKEEMRKKVEVKIEKEQELQGDEVFPAKASPS